MYLHAWCHVKGWRKRLQRSYARLNHLYLLASQVVLSVNHFFLAKPAHSQIMKIPHASFFFIIFLLGLYLTEEGTKAINA